MSQPKDEIEALRQANKELLQALKDLFNMPDYDGTPATSKVRLRAKNKARRTIAKAEAS